MSSGVSLILDLGALEIGDNFFCNKNCTISCNDKITIGDNVLFGWNVEVLDSDIDKQVIEAAKAYNCDKYTAKDVQQALLHTNKTPEDFGALLSPAAMPFLEEIAQQAQKETRKHFGNSIYMFTPIYIANYCENYCIYCGFNCHNKIRRAKLNAEEIEREMQEIAKSGLQEILILTGESKQMSDVTYIGEACKIAKKYWKDKKEYQDQYWQYEEEYYKWKEEQEE